jgi:hypothetical protein
VKSHIIPKGLYWGLYNEVATLDIREAGKLLKSKGQKHKCPTVLSEFKGEDPKKRRIGIYDRFLCSSCEDQFNEWDACAVAVLRDQIPRVVENGWQYENLDYAKLKLFFISLLWRAHAAENNFFEKIQLGPHADRLKGFIEQRIPGSPNDYTVLLWRSEELIAKVVVAPFQRRIEGVLFVRFYIPGYMALIKVDQQPLASDFESNALADSGVWFVYRKDYINGEELQWMRSMVAINEVKKNAKSD